MTTRRRRMGPEDSETRAELVRIAEQIFEEEGASAVTARRLSEALGLKRQIVHYYFHSIDDVIIAVMRSKGERYKAEVEQALREQEPLHAIWSMHGDPLATAAIMEFTVLGLRREAIRAETSQLIDLYRSMFARAVEAELKRRGIAMKGSVDALIAIVTQVRQTLALETALGARLGHDDEAELLERMIQAYLDCDSLTLEPGEPERRRGHG